MITDAEMIEAGFRKLSDGSWLSPVRPPLTPQEAVRIYNLIMKPQGQSQDTGRRSVHSVSQDTGIKEQT